jgi:hypothetical protein
MAVLLLRQTKKRLPSKPTCDVQDTFKYPVVYCNDENSSSRVQSISVFFSNATVLQDQSELSSNKTDDQSEEAVNLECDSRTEKTVDDKTLPSPSLNVTV